MSFGINLIDHFLSGFCSEIVLLKVAMVQDVVSANE